VAELVALADKSGWFIVVVILVAWKFIPVLAEKIFPEWVSARRADEAAKRANLETITSRLITVVENNSRFMSVIAVSMNSLERALDGNTHQLAQVGEVVRTGPACPLPDCPFMSTTGPNG
jgi:hypothetical protein